MAKAVQKLRSAGIDLDARLGDLQTVTRNDKAIPIHGGTEMEGVFNKVASDPDFDNADGIVGYPEVTDSSSSWVMVTEFTNNGPRCHGILTYSISTNPESKHYSDQTRKYSKKQWLKIPFKNNEVEAGALKTKVITEGASDCEGDGWREFGQPVFEDCDDCLAYFQSLQGQGITGFTNGD